MADEVVYRLVAGDGITLTENPSARTVEVSVPGLAQKVNTSDLSIGSTAAPGLLELATQQETNEGTRPDLAVSPATLAGRTAQEDRAGIIALASGAEALSLQNATKAMPPLRVAQAMAQFGLGVAAVAQAEAVNLNNKGISGSYYINGSASSNIPWPGEWGVLIVTASNTTAYTLQHYVSLQSAPKIAWRVRFNGVWQPWIVGFTSANFDPNSKANTSGNYPNMAVGSAGSAAFASSAGNADTVDGLHASAFARTSGTYNGLFVGGAANANALGGQGPGFWFPNPQGSNGSQRGYMYGFSTFGAVQLPAGGTWFAFLIGFTADGRLRAAYTGFAAGGSVLDAGGGGQNLGWAMRVA